MQSAFAYVLVHRWECTVISFMWIWGCCFFSTWPFTYRYRMMPRWHWYTPSTAVTASSLFLSPLSIFPPPSSCLSWLQLYLCALGRLQRGALWGDAAAEIRLDPAEERREQVGQQRHPAVPRISGCRAVPPSPTQALSHRQTHSNTCTHILRAPQSQPITHKHYNMSK